MFATLAYFFLEKKNRLIMVMVLYHPFFMFSISMNLEMNKQLKVKNKE